MRTSTRRLHAIAFALLACSGGIGAQQSTLPPQTPVFRSGAKLVLVDAIVRDARGAIVSDLQRSDFQVLEDGKPQQIVTFAFETIADAATPLPNPALLTRSAKGRGGAAPADSSVSTLTSETAAGHRLLTLLFDVSSMQPDEVQRSVDAALAWVDKKMSPADSVAIASVGSSLQILADFSADKERVRSVLSKRSPRAVSHMEVSARIPHQPMRPAAALTRPHPISIRSTTTCACGH